MVDGVRQPDSSASGYDETDEEKVPGCVGVSRRKVANERVVRGKN